VVLSARSRKHGVDALCHQIERIAANRQQQLLAVRITAPSASTLLDLQMGLSRELIRRGLRDVEVIVTEASGAPRLVATEFRR
jgi:hypothetical protein